LSGTFVRVEESAIEGLWSQLEVVWPRGTKVRGVVFAVRPFGFFVDLGTRFLGLIEAPDTDDALEVGDVVEAWVVRAHPGLRQILLATMNGPYAHASEIVPAPAAVRDEPTWPPRLNMVSPR
jgi:ribosomal protein S1